MVKLIQVADNDPQLASTIASERLHFGTDSRYVLYAAHTRFDCVTWIVRDTETPDDEMPDLASFLTMNDDINKVLGWCKEKGLLENGLM